MNPAKLQPALLGGVTIGVLSALPVIYIGNCCCGAWILFGGALAAYLMQQNHPEPIQIGSFVWLIVTIPINLMMAPIQSRMAQRALENATEMAPELRGLFESMGTGPAIGLGMVFGFFVMLVVCTMFGMLGGLFGALMFRKSPPPVVPPPIPPQGF